MRDFESKDRQRYLPTFKGCLICGEKAENPHTCNLRFKVTEEGVETVFEPKAVHQGYEKVIHGGMLCALLDETLGWAVAVERKRYFMTGELTVRFIRPLTVGTRVTVQGRCRENKSRYSVAEGEILDSKGRVYARGKGKFFLMSEDQAKKVDRIMTYHSGDIDVLKGGD